MQIGSEVLKLLHVDRQDRQTDTPELISAFLQLVAAVATKSVQAEVSLIRL